MFEARNRIHFIYRNITNVVRFYSGPIKFTLLWLDGIDKMVGQHPTTRDADEERNGDKPPPHEARKHGDGLNSCVGICLLELL